MPKQRSTRTVADVKTGLDTQTQQSGDGQPDNTPVVQVKAEQARAEQKESTPLTPASQGQERVTGEQGATPSPALQEARRDADAPLTVEESTPLTPARTMAKPKAS